MTAYKPLPDLSHDEILLLPAEQRLPYVEGVRVNYPRWNTLLQLIEECHNTQPYSAEPPCILIVGPTGAGKTKLHESYRQRYKSITTEFGRIIPILCGEIPAYATISSLLTALLTGLGDPRPDRGTIDGKTIRLKNLIRDCQVQLFILDEVQHFIDRDNKKILLNVSNWLKALIKDTKVACILVGLEGEANKVVDANPQLARLFGDSHLLAPFQWDIDQRNTIAEFIKFLTQLQMLLPLREATKSDLHTFNVALRCFLASEGLMAHLMKLIRGATAMALIDGQEYLTLEYLSQAFLKYLAPDRRNIKNPFTANMPEMPRKKSDTPSVGEAATNNRASKRKPSDPTLGDVIRS
ncbi:TniB family NTP-binding protein [Herpetosiphon giganteus]|uniref:TniB family NTP-binding protein n=1 Tax=Herpetosiphon giganteus TaxID=2029754 RepID=UPI00195A44F4|nr:TniB family NTP-binding protein [Herpetosiphon giganteus]MBM7842183.1 hypothetical protein [Herpetosiphon giganteus]